MMTYRRGGSDKSASPWPLELDESKAEAAVEGRTDLSAAVLR
ncbi:MAG: hypothetical protein ACQEUT_17635 [Bacillota bacterium]